MMEQKYLCLILAIFATSHACIPTKTPEKAIPATPGGPGGPSPQTCPSLTKWTTCNVQPFTCADAIITPTSVTCAMTGAMVVVRLPDLSNGFMTSGILECRGTDWTRTEDGDTLTTVIGAPTALVACIFL